ncbi:MAG: ribosome maturation factor RimP [Rickettsiaceae bacterium]|nr:ribosome maturation factor RimP [Rickettsiaceae bacterium]
MEKKIAELIESTVNDLGFGIVKIAINGSSNKIVEIFIERLDGEKIEVGDCQIVSRNISAILDVEDIISGKYFLEVSSAGLERPLVTLQDFEKYSDSEIKIRLKEPHNGNLSFRGKLLGVVDKKIKLKSKNVEIGFDFENIKKANLVLTDEMFRELLNKSKKK